MNLLCIVYISPAPVRGLDAWRTWLYSRSWAG